ncbi:DoxX family protein [Sediminibacterium ginsengisoli]|uniref:Putative oxidoreductase n=1 Tax=Sediminibacterium ginsengisoli TaxID=413434 RepID=A0A1T4RG59_9BACT|nr:DoxX family protein [Sediminibacterium ginsengisoli]SKA14718.1 putative oxidoreductase [Sediminibacterium ginsengisoli]
MQNKLLRTGSLNPEFAALIVRLLFGCLFINYGYAKLTGFNQILPMFGDIIGIGSKLSLILVVFAEFFCGILITIGLFTRLAAIPVFITMVVAYFIAHANDPFLVKTPAFVYMILSIVIFINGSGRFSVDRLIFKK